MNPIKHTYNACLFAILLFMFTNYAFAQNDSTKAKQDTTIHKEKYHRKDAIILYGGINFNDLKVSSNVYESASGTGWHLGVMYKRESFFYWQLGARLNNAEYNLHQFSSTDTIRSTFSVTDLDIPITVGINFLPMTKRVLNIHAFLSAVPVLGLKVESNTLGITKDDTNTFKLYGQVGAGIDIFFFVLDGGFNFGLTDLLKDAQSKPNQGFVSLGFRF